MTNHVTSWSRLRGAAVGTSALVLALAACGPEPAARPAGREPADVPLVAPGDLPPVALDANSPVVYPPRLLRAGVEGTTIVRLFVDQQGSLVRDSTRIAESSGYPALDSAALAAAPRLHYAPAMRDGKPVAAPFLQPIQFRNPARPVETP